MNVTDLAEGFLQCYSSSPHLAVRSVCEAEQPQTAAVRAEHCEVKPLSLKTNPFPNAELSCKTALLWASDDFGYQRLV